MAKICGYDSEGRVKEFDLKPGETLPQGWLDRPPPGTHPNDPNREKNIAARREAAAAEEHAKAAAAEQPKQGGAGGSGKSK